MTRHTAKPVTKSRGSVKENKVWTITEAAKELGISREHLSRVLHGHRPSQSLLQRYAELEGEKPEPTLEHSTAAEL